MIRVIFVALMTTLRPLFGPPGCCRYTLTCTKYAQLVLKDLPLYKALPLIFRRVLACNPFTGLFSRASRRRLSRYRLK